LDIISGGYVVAELVEASKRPQEKANEAGGFDRLSHREREN